MNDSGDRTTAISVLRIPAATGEISPSAKRRASSTGIGTLELAISATITAESTSQVIIRRRGGTRSTRLDSNAPPNRYGTNASVNVKPARNGEDVRS